MKIDLIDLDCNIDYEYNSPSIGGFFSDTGECEMIPASVTITSVICKGIQIITIIPEDQLREMECEILTNLSGQN